MHPAVGQVAAETMWLKGRSDERITGTHHFSTLLQVKGKFSFQHSEYFGDGFMNMQTGFGTGVFIVTFKITDVFLHRM